MQAVVELLERSDRAALATVTRTSGSTPQVLGARLLLRRDGSRVGTVGGGAIEEAVLDQLRECLQTRESRTREWDLIRDLGMCCGGRMEVFMEAIEGTPRLILLGAGHVAQATASLAARVGFAPVVVDAREEFNDEARFPHCTRILKEPKEAVAELRPTAGDWLLIVTHDHRLDEEALACFGAQPHAYLGMIGSRRKIARILQRLQAKERLPDLSRVYTPVGLDIGAVTPDEIAVSVVAELIALRAVTTGGGAKRGEIGAHLRLDRPQIEHLLALTAADPRGE
ncbi:MAG: XdhC family protein [Polyangiaceae bacterium]|nr:XdhC family protein [Polyangiaceae bacterium]MCB9607413.1 XdhC family protein [Polyangiaceae bacterium]